MVGGAEIHRALCCRLNRYLGQDERRGELWQEALVRIGVQKFVWSLRLYGLRHFTTWRVEDIELEQRPGNVFSVTGWNFRLVSGIFLWMRQRNVSIVLLMLRITENSSFTIKVFSFLNKYFCLFLFFNILLRNFPFDKSNIINASSVSCLAVPCRIRTFTVSPSAARSFPTKPTSASSTIMSTSTSSTGASPGA